MKEFSIMIQGTISSWTEDTMSLLTVEKLGHTFGDRTLFKDVSMRLLAGEHVGLVGANGVGKSTFMNIITGQLIHDQGRRMDTHTLRLLRSAYCFNARTYNP